MSEASTAIKRGSVRGDGMVFWQYHPDYPDGERWVSADVFEKKKASHRENKRRSYRSNPALFCAKEKSRRNAKCPIARRDYSLKSRFGIGVSEYADMFSAQGGVCAICSEPETMIRCGSAVPLSVDHCHETGAVRGLLCSKCNMAIGHLNDNPFLARAAADYLESAKSRAPISLTPPK
jgi:hypothetical protein